MKYILITGSGSGIGLETCKTFQRRNYHIFACDINIDNIPKDDNVTPIKLDITSNDNLEQAYRQVIKITDKLDIIINCAGILRMDSLIESDVSNTEKVVSVNLFGTMKVNKTFFPLINTSKGRIINISSETGWLTPSPFNGPYTISKYALEAYNDSLRRELNFLGIKVIKIQPGSFKTNMHNTTLDSFSELKSNSIYYKKVLSKMGRRMKKELESANDMKYLMNALIDACENKNPRICYRVKNSRSMMAISKLPEKMVDNIYLKFLK